VISRAGGTSQSRAPRGIDRTTFYRLMERHGLQRDDGDQKRWPLVTAMLRSL